MVMATFQNVIDSARVDLQDAGKTRYTDAELLEYANDGVQEGFRYRPDFKLGGYSAAPVVYVVGNEVPFPLTYQMILKHYVVARAELRDDEYALDGRAAAFLGRFEKELKK
jgi:hypothetical protein